MNRPEIVLVFARADNGVIGVNGGLPWRLPDDLRRFKQLTTGCPMVMGRKTFESLPGLLQGRRHIVLTRDIGWTEDGAEVVHSLEDALKAANAPHVCVIGGAEIYALFLPHADRIELTEVHVDVQGDTRFSVDGSAQWEEVARESHAAQDDKPSFDFVTLRRKANEQRSAV